ncbi:hypothetical protein F0562_004679 [Nyssa sinensis]|uniref:WAT1-related protein n=1 Tax=Nyssa sinensis TaxID=561372 RepID=A0A5J5C1P3_9ASTE|nr:hypothetical protein F0562_004679 [Nyssa sinensis]
MGFQSFLKDAAPFAAMVLVECGEVVMTTVTKAAMNRGISNFVYVVYYNSLGLLFLLPYFIFHSLRKNKRPALTLPLLWRFFLLGLLGKCLVLFGYVGINYSSPVLAAALGNLTPIFTFLLAIIFRMEKIDIRSSSSIAKSVGTIVAVSGAFIVTLYKGPPIGFETTRSSLLHHQLLLSPQSKWVLGGFFLALSYLFNATWSILQAIFGSAIRTSVLTWCLHKKDPLYVAMFKPLGMVIAQMVGIIFLADQLRLGSVIGAIIIAIGFYTVIWGQTKEKDNLKVEDDFVGGGSSRRSRSFSVEKAWLQSI